MWANLDRLITVSTMASDGTGAGRTPEYPAAVRTVRVPAWHGPERRAGIPYPVFGPRLLPVLWREVGRCDVVHAHGDTSGGSGCAATSEQGGASARSAPARESEQLGHQAKWPNGGRNRG